MVRRLAPGALALLMLAMAYSSVHAQLKTLSDLYRYHAVNRDLTEVLRGFAADQRLNLVLDPGIGSRTVSEEVEMHPTEFLDYITGKYGLVWYFDGTSLYVYRGDQLATHAFPLRYTTPERVAEVMKSLNAFTDRYPFRILEKENVILAIAPPRMLEIMKFVIQTLESKQKVAASAQISIAVFPLKHASAADQTFEFADSSIVVPGVASVLQSVVSGQAIPGPMANYLPRDRPRLKGKGLDRFSTEEPPWTPEALLAPLQNANRPPQTSPQAPQNPEEDAIEDAPADTPPPGSLAFQPTISADMRINAVIIRDHPDRMPSYEKVVKALDRPTGIIEITAKIIDVSQESAFEWGIPLNTEWGDGGLSNSFSVQLSATDASNFAVTLLRDEAMSFTQHIKALEQEGQARIASRPSLLTMDNVEAQINNSETFFVKIEGSFEVDLFDVSAGTSMSIIPHIIEEGDSRVVKLNVKVDNGSVLQQTVNEIPRVINDSLTTQAVLRENESLLIGGLIREEDSITESRVPVLGRLPAVGALFRTEERVTDYVERLILIEPKIVAYSTAKGEQNWIYPSTPPDPSTAPDNDGSTSFRSPDLEFQPARPMTAPAASPSHTKSGRFSDRACSKRLHLPKPLLNQISEMLSPQTTPFLDRPITSY